MMIDLLKNRGISLLVDREFEASGLYCMTDYPQQETFFWTILTQLRGRSLTQEGSPTSEGGAKEEGAKEENGDSRSM